eukprot:scaffold10856_cov229-Amphora_coffeaeformis.AAC.11
MENIGKCTCRIQPTGRFPPPVFFAVSVAALCTAVCRAVRQGRRVGIGWNQRSFHVPPFRAQQVASNPSRLTIDSSMTQ